PARARGTEERKHQSRAQGEAAEGQRHRGAPRGGRGRQQGDAGGGSGDQRGGAQRQERRNSADEGGRAGPEAAREDER
ncbi:transcription termination factor Rho, partial [Mycobacterium tuberculosis]